MATHASRMTQVAWRDVARVLPVQVRSRVTTGILRDHFVREVERFDDCTDTEMVQTVRVCLRNIRRLEDDLSADGEIQLVLLPELCERLTPGVRTELRRITSSSAESVPGSWRTSIFRRMSNKTDEEWERYGLASDQKSGELRRRIAQAQIAPSSDLASQLSFAIARSILPDKPDKSVAHSWLHDNQLLHPFLVYDSALIFIVAPVVARRVLQRTQPSA